MPSLSNPTFQARPARPWAKGMAALLSLMLAGPAVMTPTPVHAAASVADAATPFELPAKTSEMLVAPLDRWKPLLVQADKILGELAAADNAALAGIHVQRTVLFQAQEAWPEVLDAIAKTRQTQSSEAGRQTAGLLNEVLAKQALGRGDSAWLKRQLRDQVLAMSWADVEPSIRTLRQQLAGMTAEGVRRFVVNKMDTAVSVAQNRSSLGFVVQLLALRFQLSEVLPRRDLLVEALDEAIATRSAGAAR